MYLICNICNVKIDSDLYLNHLEEHSFQFTCTKCEFSTDDLVDVAFHEHQKHHNDTSKLHYTQFIERLKSHYFCTKAVFGNGLILTKYNLLGTNLNDYNEFRYMIETIVDIKMKKYKWLLNKKLTKEIDENSSDDSQSVMSDEFILSSLASSTAYNYNYHDSQLHRFKSTKPYNKEFSREFRRQLRIIKNICIHGIPRRENENLYRIVLRVFDKLDANILSRDILHVHRISKSNPLIIVTFSNPCAKRKLMICCRTKSLQTSDVIDLLPGVFPSKIHIFSHLTTFFEELRKIAKHALIKKRLFSYCLTKHGFLVKRTKNSVDKFIFSQRELHAYIKQKDQYMHKSASQASDTSYEHDSYLLNC